jgi:hypothetical protein
MLLNVVECGGEQIQLSKRPEFFFKYRNPKLYSAGPCEQNMVRLIFSSKRLCVEEALVVKRLGHCVKKILRNVQIQRKQNKEDFVNVIVCWEGQVRISSSE